MGSAGCSRWDLRAGTASRVGNDDFGNVGESEPTGLASHGGKLYMVGASTDQLYEIAAASGGAIAVGSAVMFDVPVGGDGAPGGDIAPGGDTAPGGDVAPSGLVSHGSGLYMVGGGGWLYTLDTVTGAATRVGSSAGFGVSEGNPGGIASGYDKPTVFTIDSATGEIDYTGGLAAAGRGYTLYAQVSDDRGSQGDASRAAVDGTVPVTVVVENRPPSFEARAYSYPLASGGSGRSTPVAIGAPQATDPENRTLTYSLRASDSPERMYMTRPESRGFVRAGQYHVRRGARGPQPRSSVLPERFPLGMAWHNGQLYMTGSGNNGLYTLNVVTGEAVLIADRDQITGSDESLFLLGVASHGGELYVTTVFTGRLYRVDLDTLTGTRIGSDNFGSLQETHPIAIASHGSPAELYMVGFRQ